VPIRWRPGGSTIYAIVRNGGKQYRVEPDQLIDVDRLPAEVGSMVELDDVLLIAGNGDVRVGQPRLEGARVIAEVVEHGRGPKIIVFKYKSKTRYHRRRGHRQGYTRLAVRQILTAEGPAKAEEKPKRRRAAKAEAEAEAKPARRTRTRKPKAEPEAAEAAAALAEAPDATTAPPEAAEAKPTRRRRAPRARAEQPEPGTEEKPARRTREPKPEAELAAPVEVPEGEAKPVRRTRARKAQAEQPETGTKEKPARRTRARKPAAEGAAAKTDEETSKSGE
jgi:large subunit ribosomal protein L21